MAVIVTIRREWRRPDSGTFLTGFLAHFVWLVVIFKAFEFGFSAGAAALIAAMQPALTALLAPIFLNERNSWLQWAGIAVGFLGVVIFVGADRTATGAALWVYLLPLLASASLTFITIWERRRTSNPAGDMPIFTSLFWHAALTAGLLVPLALWFEEFAATWNGDLVFSVVWLVVVVSVLAFGLMFHLIRTREATRVSALQYFVPPVTMILAWIVFAEALTLNGMAGLGVTMAGFWLMQRGAV